MKSKDIDSLMEYICNEKRIKIHGDIQKKELRFMGYFHGYKGYRYYRSSNSLFSFKDFDELQLIYKFDMKLKTLLYPQIMFLETALKNFALEIILEEANDKNADCKRFDDIFLNY